MTNTPSPTDEDRELIARLRRESNSVFPSRMRDGHAYHATACALDKAADRLESLLSDRAKLEGDWFDKAIRDHADEHGPSGGAWNISMVLDRLHRAKPVLNRSPDHTP